ncbi:MAG: hypothetical protein KF774_03150 [Planctomyces sp.]|nr:hypothetical protein [Planctomyces sp.]
MNTRKIRWAWFAALAAGCQSPNLAGMAPWREDADSIVQTSGETAARNAPAGLPGPAQKPDKSPSPQELAREGELYLQQHFNADAPGALEAARSRFDAAARLDPNFATAHHRLGIIADLQRRFPDAEQHYLNALALDPQNASILSDLGYSHVLQHNWSTSEAYLTRALQVSPRNEMTLDHLAYVYVQQGQDQRAAAVLQQFLPPDRISSRMSELIADRQRIASVRANPPIQQQAAPQHQFAQQHLQPDDRRAAEVQRIHQTGFSGAPNQPQHPLNSRMSAAQSPLAAGAPSQGDIIRDQLARIDREGLPQDNAPIVVGASHMFANPAPETRPAEPYFGPPSQFEHQPPPGGAPGWNHVPPLAAPGRSQQPPSADQQHSNFSQEHQQTRQSPPPMNAWSPDAAPGDWATNAPSGRDPQASSRPVGPVEELVAPSYDEPHVALPHLPTTGRQSFVLDQTADAARSGYGVPSQPSMNAPIPEFDRQPVDRREFDARQYEARQHSYEAMPQDSGWPHEPTPRENPYSMPPHAAGAGAESLPRIAPGPSRHSESSARAARSAPLMAGNRSADPTREAAPRSDARPNQPRERTAFGTRPSPHYEIPDESPYIEAPPIRSAPAHRHPLEEGLNDWGGQRPPRARQASFPDDIGTSAPPLDLVRQPQERTTPPLDPAAGTRPPNRFDEARRRAALMGLGVGPGQELTPLEQPARRVSPGSDSQWNGSAFQPPRRELPDQARIPDLSTSPSFFEQRDAATPRNSLGQEMPSGPSTMRRHEVWPAAATSQPVSQPPSHPAAGVSAGSALDAPWASSAVVNAMSPYDEMRRRVDQTVQQSMTETWGNRPAQAIPSPASGTPIDRPPPPSQQMERWNHTAVRPDPYPHDSAQQRTSQANQPSQLPTVTPTADRMTPGHAGVPRYIPQTSRAVAPPNYRDGIVIPEQYAPQR